MPLRAAAGLVLALLVAGAARRARSLSPSGAVAATVLGTLAIAAGWGWGALLIAYFVSSSALSRWRSAEKTRRTGGIVEKGGERDARQVLANGAPFAVAALGALVVQSPRGLLLCGAAGAGVLAAAAADTWATEVGTLAGRPPRSVRTLRPVPPGTSGAVSVPGTFAMLVGAAAVALLAAALGISPALPAVLGGLSGALADTLLGATIQERRRCPRCGVATERSVHDCGTATERVAGMPGVDNDVVNLACTVVGAAVSAAAAAWTT
jgi:uncharacterized protein (TIGR00297 family)